MNSADLAVLVAACEAPARDVTTPTASDPGEAPIVVPERRLPRAIRSGRMYAADWRALSATRQRGPALVAVLSCLDEACPAVEVTICVHDVGGTLLATVGKSGLLCPCCGWGPMSLDRVETIADRQATRLAGGAR